MAQLPANRTKLNSAISDQSQSLTPASGKANREALLEAYDTIDFLNQKVDGLVASGALSPLPPLNFNQLINGNFDIAQEGVTFTNPLNNAYTLDQWKVIFNTGGGTFPTIIHNQRDINGEFPGSFHYYRVNFSGVGGGYGSSMLYRLSQPIEFGTRYLCGLNRKVTVSFWARSDIPNKKIAVHMDQNYGSGGSPANYLGNSTFALSSNWKEFTKTFITQDIAGKVFGIDDNLAVNIDFMWGIDWNTPAEYASSGNVDIAQLQVNTGDAALPFQPRSFSEELLLAQRYYEKSYDYSNYPGTATASGSNQFASRNAVAANTSGGIAIGIWPFKVQKRVRATMKIYSPSGAANAVRVNYGSDRTGASLVAAQNSLSGVSFDNTSPVAITLDNIIEFHLVADARI